MSCGCEVYQLHKRKHANEGHVTAQKGLTDTIQWVGDNVFDPVTSRLDRVNGFVTSYIPGPADLPIPFSPYDLGDLHGLIPWPDAGTCGAAFGFLISIMGFDDVPLIGGHYGKLADCPCWWFEQVRAVSGRRGECHFRLTPPIACTCVAGRERSSRNGVHV